MRLRTCIAVAVVWAGSYSSDSPHRLATQYSAAAALNKKFFFLKHLKVRATSWPFVPKHPSANFLGRGTTAVSTAVNRTWTPYFWSLPLR